MKLNLNYEVYPPACTSVEYEDGEIEQLDSNNTPTSGAETISLESATAIERLRKRFPFFREEQIIYFDNASTTQKPESVIETMDSYYRNKCVNAGRANYELSSSTSDAIEKVRKKVSKFLDTKEKNIGFTSGATASLNLVALSWGLFNLKEGDQVMVCMDDHKSATLPWLNLQKILKRQNVNIEIVPFKIHDVGDYDLKSIEAAVTERTRVLAMSHIHHLYGMDMEVQEVRDIVGDDVIITLDACQSVGHIPVKASKLPVDFISFSGHKMFAGTGIGVLYAKDDRIKELGKVYVGGQTKVSAKSKTSLSAILESGTPNICSILSLGKAIDFIKEIGISTIESQVAKLTRYSYEKLKEVPGIDFGPGPGRCDCPGGFGIIPFKITGIDSNDLGFLLDDESILVRTGDHCKSDSNIDDESEESYVRLSMQVYNTKAEVDQLIEVLDEAIS